MNDNEPLRVGDRVRLRQFPHVQGYVWDRWPEENMVIVAWEDDEQDVYVRDPRRWLEKIAPLPLTLVP